MRRRVWIWLFSGLLAGAPLVVEAAGSMRMRHVTARTMMRGFALEPLATDAVRPADRTFLEKSLELSRQQARLAELAVAQAGGADVRRLAQQIVVDHRALGDAVEALIRRKGVVRSGAAASEAAGEAYRQLGAKAGAEFDREFVRMFSAQHEELMTLFEQAASESRDADIRALAAAELPTLRAHRNTLTELRKTVE